MIYLSLFWEFLKVGMFSFGGAYGAIPLIQESVISRGWMDEAMFANMIAISESTPGPIMVNSATYVGSSQAGILGAALATLGVILPSFVVILLITVLFRRFMQSRGVRCVLKGIQPCIIGIILATGAYMAVSLIFDGTSCNLISLLIFAILVSVSILYRVFRKKAFSPILLIVISAVLGIILY